MSAPATRYLLTIEAEVSPPVVVGDPGGGIRRFVPITGGKFSGTLAGKVLPGADWQTVAASGAIELAAHYAIETDSGERVEVLSNGVRMGPPEVLERLARGEAVDPALYYFRTSIRFRTGAPALMRLNHVLALAIAERQASLVRLEVHEVL